MILQHVNVKIHVDGELLVDPERFIGVFHRWIAEQSMDELLIDVADYRHVSAGPGVVLVGHEADYAMDHRDDCWGLLYNRKASVEGSNADRFAQALRSAARACQLLESELQADGPLTFSRKRFEVVINDRALAPNTEKSFEAIKPELEEFLSGLLGHSDFTIDRSDDDPRCRLGVTVQLAQPVDYTQWLTPTHSG